MEKFFEVIKTLDVEPFASGDGDFFRFRLEITQEVGAEIYFGKVYRQEFYRLQPTFSQSKGKLHDEGNDGQVLVVDEMFDSERLCGSSVDEVVIKFKEVLMNIFA